MGIHGNGPLWRQVSRGIAAALPFALVFAAWSWWINTPVATFGEGSYGDAFGALNTLFAGLAFAAVVVTLWLQRAELREQRRLLGEQSRLVKDESLQRSLLSLLDRYERAVLEYCNPERLVSSRMEFTMSRRSVHSGVIRVLEDASLEDLRDGKQAVFVVAKAFRAVAFVLLESHRSEVPGDQLNWRLVEEQLTEDEKGLILLDCLAGSFDADDVPVLVDRLSLHDCAPRLTSLTLGKLNELCDEYCGAHQQTWAAKIPGILLD